MVSLSGSYSPRRWRTLLNMRCSTVCSRARRAVLQCLRTSAARPVMSGWCCWISLARFCSSSTDFIDCIGRMPPRLVTAGGCCSSMGAGGPVTCPAGRGTAGTPKPPGMGAAGGGVNPSAGIPVSLSWLHVRAMVAGSAGSVHVRHLLDFPAGGHEQPAADAAGVGVHGEVLERVGDVRVRVLLGFLVHLALGGDVEAVATTQRSDEGLGAGWVDQQRRCAVDLARQPVVHGGEPPRYRVGPAGDDAEA